MVLRKDRLQELKFVYQFDDRGSGRVCRTGRFRNRTLKCLQPLARRMLSACIYKGNWKATIICVCYSILAYGAVDFLKPCQSPAEPQMPLRFCAAAPCGRRCPHSTMYSDVRPGPIVVLQPGENPQATSGGATTFPLQRSVCLAPGLFGSASFLEVVGIPASPHIHL